MMTPLILAAGASTRMGRPKALLEFGKHRAIELVLEACAGWREPVVVLGAHAEEIRPFVRGRVVVNQDWARGQTGSLKAGLREIRDDFLLFPVDYPLVTRDDVRAIASAKGPIVIPSHNLRRGHPVRFAASLVPEFLALEDNTPARVVVQAHEADIVYVTEVSPYVLMDVDTPEDYAQALKEWTFHER